MADIVGMKAALEALPDSILSRAEQMWRKEFLERLNAHGLVTAREWQWVSDRLAEWLARAELPNPGPPDPPSKPPPTDAEPRKPDAVIKDRGQLVREGTSGGHARFTKPAPISQPLKLTGETDASRPRAAVSVASADGSGSDSSANTRERTGGPPRGRP